MSRKKINQNDLRRLMKERSERVVKNDEKIESPLAKYDSLGRLSCIVCGVQIGAAVAWRHHILTKSHKENVSKKLKRKTNDATNVTPSISLDNINKIPATDTEKISLNGVSHGDIASKRLKTETAKSSVGLLQGYSSSSDEEEDDPVVSSQNKRPAPEASKPSTSSVLPPDFFDPPPSNSTALAVPSISKNSPDIEKKDATVKGHTNTSNTLPEGFFDDPIQDAKARNVEYKDPKEEEWEKFQKTIAEETTVSESILEEDAQESAANTNIEQIDEQIYKWQKVNELLSKREEIEEKIHRTMSLKEQTNSNSSTEGEEEDLDLFLDWRAKDLWGK